MVVLKGLIFDDVLLFFVFNKKFWVIKNKVILVIFNFWMLFILMLIYIELKFYFFRCEICFFIIEVNKIKLV